MWANRYVAGTGWRGAGPIESDTVNGVRPGVVAIGSGGEAMAVWEKGSGNAFNIVAAAFR